jgi:8-oxo-dGTP pyrophosphatase MutT (NUDIX family)
MMRLQFAQKAVVVNEGRALLVRKTGSDPHNPGRWDLPGGRIKAADESLDEHLRREVWEETGLSVAPGRPISLWFWDMVSDGEPVRVIAASRYCTVESGTIDDSNRERDDHLDECLWVPLSELLNYDVIPSQRPTITAVVEEYEEKFGATKNHNLGVYRGREDNPRETTRCAAELEVSRHVKDHAPFFWHSEEPTRVVT